MLSGTLLPAAPRGPRERVGEATEPAAAHRLHLDELPGRERNREPGHETVPRGRNLGDLRERTTPLTAPGRLSMKVVLHTMSRRFGEPSHISGPGGREPDGLGVHAPRVVRLRRARAEPSANVERMLAAAAPRKLAGAA